MDSTNEHCSKCWLHPEQNGGQVCSNKDCTCHTNEEKKTMEERLESLAAINYNLYFGSPADRADKFDEDGEKVRWTYDEALEEIEDFIKQELQSLVADILGKKKAYHVRIEDIIQVARERGL